MKLHYLKLSAILFAGISMIGASSCRNTAQGVVRDTKHNTGKVGQSVENVGEKIQESTR